MKKSKLLCSVVAATVLFASCANNTDETEVESEARTTSQQEETEPEETETESTEDQGPVELTVDNYFDVDPEDTEWGRRESSADIISLVDLDYIQSSYSTLFEIDSVEDLASVTYFVNTYPLSRTSEDNFFIWVDLLADIDLSGYNWAPMGLDEGDDYEHAFSGIFAGNGHYIYGLNIENEDDCNGFFGLAYNGAAGGVRIVDAVVSGADSALVAGSSYDFRYIDFDASGTLPDKFDGDYESLFNVYQDPGNNRYIYCSFSALNGSGELVSEEDFTVNPYPENGSHQMIDMYDPDHDGEFVYGEPYFGDAGF